MLKVLANEIKQKKGKKRHKTGIDEIKLSLFMGNMMIYVENSKESKQSKNKI